MSTEQANKSGINKLVNRLAAEKYKVAVTVCLICLMGIMWIRVLGGKGPQTSEATPDTMGREQGQQEEKTKFSVVELPKIEGRNDMLTHDVFSIDAMNLKKKGELSLQAEMPMTETMQLSRELKLQMIGLGGRPEALINDKLVYEGDTIVVGNGVSRYECKVVKIESDKVTIKWNEAEITLKLGGGVESSQ